jgi:hypothetical protein
MPFQENYSYLNLCYLIFTRWSIAHKVSISKSHRISLFADLVCQEEEHHQFATLDKITAYSAAISSVGYLLTLANRIPASKPTAAFVFRFQRLPSADFIFGFIVAGLATLGLVNLLILTK